MIKLFPEDADLTPKKRVKFGIDPTAPKLHLGHFVPLRQVKKLQDKGHEITIVLGTFTATLGDPTGRDKTRPLLNPSICQDNAKEIIETITKILSPGFSVFRNHHHELSISEFFEFCSIFTVHHMLTRDFFQKRMEDGKSIAIHELLVPVMQGWDSVLLESQIEVGGQDQLFNFQIARKMQEHHNQEPQVCLMTPIIRGTDDRKMSKSLGNTIFLDEEPVEMFGQCMSISDEVMMEWLPLLTELSPMKRPMETKLHMSWDIVRQLHGEENANQAQDAFNRTIREKQIPQDVKDLNVTTLREAVVLLRECSRTEARQLIKAGAVKMNGVLRRSQGPVQVGDAIKVGKRHHGRIV